MFSLASAAGTSIAAGWMAYGGDGSMFRRMAIALTVTTAVVALTPTIAAARGGHGGGHGGPWGRHRVPRGGHRLPWRLPRGRGPRAGPAGVLPRGPPLLRPPAF